MKFSQTQFTDASNNLPNHLPSFAVLAVLTPTSSSFFSSFLFSSTLSFCSSLFPLPLFFRFLFFLHSPLFILFFLLSVFSPNPVLYLPSSLSLSLLSLSFSQLSILFSLFSFNYLCPPYSSPLLSSTSLYNSLSFLHIFIFFRSDFSSISSQFFLYFFLLFIHTFSFFLFLILHFHSFLITTSFSF
ncbi:unnamed protein product [Acanthosepion pharaonis]|uniref:Uncharacterized protein n=1 Tax=Acanthosepion pharaonis TaxID=158019 RepID=A0A812AW95_ACAPH|nr:unnamed protein product [Sepia pharaonis]